MDRTDAQRPCCVLLSLARLLPNIGENMMARPFVHSLSTSRDVFVQALSPLRPGSEVIEGADGTGSRFRTSQVTWCRRFPGLVVIVDMWSGLNGRISCSSARVAGRRHSSRMFQPCCANAHPP